MNRGEMFTLFYNLLGMKAFKLKFFPCSNCRKPATKYQSDCFFCDKPLNWKTVYVPTENSKLGSINR